MKKTKFILGMVAGAAAILSLGALASCQLELDNAEDRASVAGYAPTELAITGQTTSFVKGSTFTLGETAVVTVTYADSTDEDAHTADVTDRVTIAKPDLSTVGEGKKVTVSYTEAGVTVSCDYLVNVTNELKSIAVKTAPTNTNLVTYGTPDLTGLVITLTYSDESTKDVTYSETTAGDFTVSPVTTAGDDLDVTITYSGKTASYKADVKTVAQAAVVSYALDGEDEGVEIEGAGSFVADATFTKVFKNDGSAQRTSYLKLPSDTLQHSATSKEMTIGFWVNNTTDDDLLWHPLFSAYKQKAAANSWPMFILQSRGLAQVNCAGFCDFAAAQNDAGANTESIAWLGEQNTWHYYTCVMTETSLKVYADGNIINAWTIDGTSDGQILSGMFTSTELVYVCLGGNQAWDWGDNDSPYSFAKFSVWDVALNAEQIAAMVAAK